MVNDSKFADIFGSADIDEPLSSGRGEKPLGRPRTGKRSDPRYKQLSIFVKDANVKRVNRILEDQFNSKKDLSTLLDEYLEKFIAEHQST